MLGILRLEGRFGIPEKLEEVWGFLLLNFLQYFICRIEMGSFSLGPLLIEHRRLEALEQRAVRIWTANASKFLLLL